MPGIPSKDASFVRETPRNYALTIEKLREIYIPGAFYLVSDQMFCLK